MADEHYPVMLNEALQFLAIKDGGTYVDGTFGAGGYSKAILEAANTNVIGIDRDPAAAERAQKFTAIYGDRFTLIPGTFGNMKNLLVSRDIQLVDGIVLDIGVSSPQIDEAARGFSFAKDGPLDMRMSLDGMSAADVVNTMAADKLAEIIKELGEERHARRVASAIVEARTLAPITTTLELANIVRKVVRRSPADSIDPATRTFQALRMYVNDELGELERALAAAESILKPGGRLVVVSFHSLEDRIVKNFVRAHSGHNAAPSRHLPVLPGSANDVRPTFTVLTRSAMPPSPEECRANPRSRSARLRAAERTAAPHTDAHVGHPNNNHNQAGRV